MKILNNILLFSLALLEQWRTDDDFQGHVIARHYTIHLSTNISENLSQNGKYTNEMETIIHAQVVQAEAAKSLMFIFELPQTQISTSGVTVTNTKFQSPVTIMSIYTFNDKEFGKKMLKIELDPETSLEDGDMLEIKIPYKIEHDILFLQQNLDSKSRDSAAYFGAEQLPILWIPTNTNDNYGDKQKPYFKVKVARKVNELDVVFLLNGEDSTGMEPIPGLFKRAWENFHETCPMQPKDFQLLLMQGFKKRVFTSSDGQEENFNGTTFTVSIWAPEDKLNYYGNHINGHLFKYLNYLESKWKVGKLAAEKSHHIKIIPGEQTGISSYQQANTCQDKSSAARITLSTFGPDIRTELQVDQLLVQHYLLTDEMKESITDRSKPSPEIAIPLGIIHHVTVDTLRAIDPDLLKQGKLLSLSSKAYHFVHWCRIHTDGQVFQMLENMVTLPVLNSAITRFYENLKNKAGAKNVTQKFYDALEDSLRFHNVTPVLPPANNVSVAQIFNTWSSVTKLPTISLDTTVKDPHSVQVTLDSDSRAAYPLLWIPVSIFSDVGEHSFWISSQTPSVTISSPFLDTSTNWLLVNFNQTGSVFRFILDDHLLDLVEEQYKKDPSAIPAFNLYDLAVNYIELQMRFQVTPEQSKKSQTNVADLNYQYIFLYAIGSTIALNNESFNQCSIPI